MRCRNWRKFPACAARFSGPFFNEFAVEFPRSVKLVNAQLLRDKIIGPLSLGTAYPELTKRASGLRHGNDHPRGN